MSKFGGIRYNSLWDWSTWLIMAFSVGACIWPLFLDDDRTWRIVLIILTCVFIAFLLVLFKGIYYRIDGNNLVVYQFFVPNVFPIDKIESVKPVRSMLSAPAASIIHRIAIKFSDRKVLKSSMPLIISPVRQEEFIARLLSVNPDIKIPERGCRAPGRE